MEILGQGVGRAAAVVGLTLLITLGIWSGLDRLDACDRIALIAFS